MYLYHEKYEKWAHSLPLPFSMLFWMGGFFLLCLLPVMTMIIVIGLLIGLLIG